MVMDQAFGVVPILEYNDVHHFLLIQHQAGHWGFPKGHAEAGESPVQTACREFEEETGIAEYTVSDRACFTEHYSFENRGVQVDKTVTYYLAWLTPGDATTFPTVDIQLKEIQNYAWVNYADALHLITFDAAKQILREVNQYLLAPPQNET